MRPISVRHMWGNPRPFAKAVSDAADKGYGALEVAVLAPIEADEAATMVAQAKDAGLDLITQIHTAGFEAGLGVDQHLTSLRERIAWANSLQPTMINVHAGADHWERDEAIAFFKEFVAIGGGEASVPVISETHRARVMYNPWSTRAMLEAVPELCITADFSHWTVVAERLLPDCGDIIALSAERTRHIHARVGFGEGPQVNDPRAPENAEIVATFEGWWDQIVAARKAAGDETITICPEFGPQPYLPAQPYTRMDIAPLDQIVDWMAERLLKRYS